MHTIQNTFGEFGIDSYLLYNAIVNSTDEYVYIIDMKTDRALVSQNMCEDFDLPDQLVPHLPQIWSERIHARDQKRFADSMTRMLEGETNCHELEYQVRNHKGEYVWVVCRGVLTRHEDGTPYFFAGIVTNLGDKGKIDYITGLFTQRECEKEVTQALKQQKVEGRGGILVLGLDDFSRINNLNDHIFGDMVLRQFAQDVQNRLPPDGALFRFDGDEMTVLLRDATEQEVMEFYHKIHLYCNRRHDVDGKPYFCTTSGGIAMLGRDGKDFMTLVKCANNALLASKRQGRNTCTVFAPDLVKAELRAMTLLDRLQGSATNHMEGFTLNFQPLLRTGDSAVIGAEALLRWGYPEAPNVSPGEFIPLLEGGGLIVPVGTWVLEQAMAACKRFQEVCPGFVMNINISYLQMSVPGFVDLVRTSLERYGLSASNVVLEMTESYFVTDIQALDSTFRDLRALGLRIAMDDFGTGYSSLGMLARLPADEIKIDRAFISQIDRNGFNCSFIGAVIKLCHGVGIAVCVEGIETAEELDTVVGLEPDTMQGFHFSRPISEIAFLEKYWTRANSGAGI